MDEQTPKEVQAAVEESIRPLRDEVYRMLPEITMLKEGIGVIQNAVEKTNRRLDAMGQNMQNGFDRVLTAVDSLAGKASDRETEEASTTVMLSEYGTQLRNHETRIKQLENVGAR